MPTIFGLFENESAARAALQSINQEKIKNIGVQLVTKAEKHQFDTLKKSLKAGEAEYYEGRLDHGASLLVVETDGVHAGKITELLHKHGIKEFEAGAKVEHKIAVQDLKMLKKRQEMENQAAANLKISR